MVSSHERIMNLMHYRDGSQLNDEILHEHQIKKSFKLQSQDIQINLVQAMDDNLIVSKSSLIEPENNMNSANPDLKLRCKGKEGKVKYVEAVDAWVSCHRKQWGQAQDKTGYMYAFQGVILHKAVDAGYRTIESAAAKPHSHKDLASLELTALLNACTPKPRNIYRSSPVSKPVPLKLKKGVRLQRKGKYTIAEENIPAHELQDERQSFIAQNRHYCISISLLSTSAGSREYSDHDAKTGVFSFHNIDDNCPHKEDSLNSMAEQNVPAQPPTRTDEQIVPRSQWLIIGKSNLLFNAQKIQKNPIFQISVDILNNTNFFRAFTASASVPAIYMQQFWNTMKYDEKTGVYSCQVDEQWFDLSADLLRKALAITPVIPAHPFELPLSGNTVIDFVNELGYPELVEEIVSNIRVNQPVLDRKDFWQADMGRIYLRDPDIFLTQSKPQSQSEEPKEESNFSPHPIWTVFQGDNLLLGKQ
ncbi:hypothetical protein Tco_0658665 [Tanacetum coccineum]